MPWAPEVPALPCRSPLVTASTDLLPHGVMWGAELTPRAQSRCLGQPFPARKQPGTLRGTHRSPGRCRHRRGGGRGPGSSPAFPPFPDGAQGTASPVHPGRQGRGGGTPVCCGQGPPSGCGVEVGTAQAGCVLHEFRVTARPNGSGRASPRLPPRLRDHSCPKAWFAR